jgi:hypothetical protein
MEVEEERHARKTAIAESLNMFGLPKETVDGIVQRMNFYVENFLAPPWIHLNFQEFSDLTAEQIERLRTAFFKMGDEVRLWKESICRERLLVEVAIAAPDAYLRTMPNPYETRHESPLH